MQRPQIITKHAIGKGGDNNPDAPGSRGGERTCKLVRDIGEFAHRAVHPRP